MVYLKTEIGDLKKRLLGEMNLQCLVYHFIRDKDNLHKLNFDLSEEEAVAVKGYKKLPVDSLEIEAVISKKPTKGFNFSDNIYKLIGIHLASGQTLQEPLEKKFKNTSIKNKYLVSQCLPDYIDPFKNALSVIENDPAFVLLAFLNGSNFPDGQLENELNKFLNQASDIIDLLILEDIEKYLRTQDIVKTKFLNKDALALVVDVLNNFDDAVKKLKGERRKGHDSFKITDEYDVQDLLYFVLKSIFPKLKEEDPTPRVGIKYNKIDLIIREEGILIEVKMIRESDSNEKDYIEQLKNDIESYYECKWLKHLICYVYDPFGKTRTNQNFYDLNGDRKIKDTSFSVEVIVGK